MPSDMIRDAIYEKAAVYIDNAEEIEMESLIAEMESAYASHNYDVLKDGVPGI